MPHSKVDLSLVGKLLADDVYNRNGLLLLSRGSLLNHSDVFLLQAHGIDEVSLDVITELKVLGPVGNESLDEPFHVQIKKLLAHTPEASQRYSEAMERTKSLFGKITEVYIPPLEQFTDAFFPLLDQVLKQTGIFHPLYLVEGSEDYTYRHSINVGILCALIAKLMKRTRDEIILLGQAGLLHDVGKMLIPQEILMKPGKLTEEEFNLMKLHTTYGFKLLQQMEGTHDLLAQVALLHHERRDGSGYPEGRSGVFIPIEAQIVAVADTFDAICSDRIYKTRRSPYEAAQILWKATCRGQLNVEIVTRFINYIALLYVGRRAILSNGDIVEVVLIHTDEPMRPLVRKNEQYIDLRKYRGVSIEKMIG
ncbi:HD-GYP domain-containing protein [Brevibacillus sp. SYSU BS000544]|uniref:HD-GYP domain-containing protein n=1 Tax=Brevibacillus sp. SYSU BS000544 TaxID=3416443 RepID=UPI003CE494A4